MPDQPPVTDDDRRKAHEWCDMAEYYSGTDDLMDATARAIRAHVPAPQIIRTVEKLEALDPDTLLIPEGFNTPITRQSMDNFGITVSGAHYAVVVATGEHTRACREALEGEAT